jgi:tetratricopeptide (TPR) repeat protein
VGVNGVADGREHLIAFLSGTRLEVHDALWSRSLVISANYHSVALSEIMFPVPGIIWQQKANAYQKLGRPKDAILALEKALELDPQNQAVRERLEKLRKEAF